MWGLERMGRLYSHNEELFAETLIRAGSVMLYSGIRKKQNNLTKCVQTRLWDPFHSMFRALGASLRLGFYSEGNKKPTGIGLFHCILQYKIFNIGR